MIHVGFPAMGTEIEAWVEDEDSTQRLADWFEHVEACCSRFRPDSELSRINSSTDTEVSTGSTMTEVLHAAKHAREISSGLVDVGMGAVVARWGYDRTFHSVVDLEEEPSPMVAGRWDVEGSVLTRTGDVAIDLGGVAKGWTCDRAVDQGIATVVSAGGDLRSNDPDTIATVTGVDDDEIVRVHVGVGALATSSTAKRRWRVAGSEVAHLVDPRTMRPVHSPVVSATVLTGSALEAETGAKTVLLLGSDGLSWAAEQSWIRAAVVLWHDGSVYATSGLEVAA